LDDQSESVIGATVLGRHDESMAGGHSMDSVRGMPKADADGHDQFEDVEWRVEGTLQQTTGVLVGRTHRGLTVVTDHELGYREGSVLIPSPRSQWRGWRRPVEIKRVVQLSDAIDLIAADYVTHEPPA